MAVVSSRLMVMAIAAPVSSSLGKPNQPKISMGSMARFTTEPIVMTSPGMLALPLARMILLAIMVTVNSTAPG